MRKIHDIAMATLAAALLLSSCTKEGNGTTPETGITTITADIAHASDTKTGLPEVAEGSTGVSVYWTSGDNLSVLSGSGYGTNKKFNLSKGAGTTSGSFSGESTTGEVIAIYPYSSSTVYASGKITLDIPESQAYTSASFAQGSMPMIAQGNISTPLTFHHLFSTIAFKVNGEGKSVTKVTVVATSPLWGPAEITELDSTPVLTLTGKGEEYHTVVLDCGSGLDISEDKVFYVAVPAGTYRFAVNVLCTDGSVFHTNYVANKTFTVGKIKYNATAKTFTDNGETPVYVDGDFVGPGIKAAGVWWAPMNCGYDSEDSPLGLHYQWGRKYGHNPSTTISTDDFSYTPAESMADGNADENAKIFYIDNKCWYAGHTTGDSWESKYDPCPEGWRVPDSDELTALKETGSTEDTDGSEYGYTMGTSGMLYAQTLFLPYAGFRGYNSGYTFSGNGCYWSSTASDDEAHNDCSLYFLVSSKSAQGLYDWQRANANSVRCVKDETN